MNADQVQTIINEAAKNLPGYLALILTNECDIRLDECGDLQIDIPMDVCREDSAALMQAIKTAAEHYQPPLHPWQIN